MKRWAVPLALMIASASSLYLGFVALGDAIVGFVLYYLVCCAALPLADMMLLRGLPARGIPARLGLGRPSPRDLAIGLAAGAVMAAATIAALVILKDRVFGSGAIMEALARWGVRRERLALVYAVMLAFNGAAEEFFWRGYLYDRMAFVRNRRLAGAVPTIFFGGQHVFVISSIVPDPAVVALFLFGITGAGAVWQFLRERTKSLAPCVVSHVIVTAAYLGAFYFLSAPA